jgi:DNA-directed RNA polymerase specialized sigma24 family protein
VFSAAGEFHGGNTDAALVASDEVSPLDGLLARESAGRVQELLARLPDNQADAVRLRFFGGLKFQEIAEAQGCSLTSAKTRVRLGLLQLSQWLGASQAVLRMTGETP